MDIAIQLYKWGDQALQPLRFHMRETGSHDIMDAIDKE